MQVYDKRKIKKSQNYQIQKKNAVNVNVYLFLLFKAKAYPQLASQLHQLLETQVDYAVKNEINRNVSYKNTRKRLLFLTCFHQY